MNIKLKGLLQSNRRLNKVLQNKILKLHNVEYLVYKKLILMLEV